MNYPQRIMELLIKMSNWVVIRKYLIALLIYLAIIVGVATIISTWGFLWVSKYGG